jgi:very-short-patch-repair endonuclease
MFLREHFPDVKFNVPFDWGVHPETGRQFRFDFVVDKTIIELDGDQHFIQVGKWTSPDITKDRDNIRMRQSRENGFKTVRLLQRDVFFNTYDWKTVLLESINSDKDMFLCLNGEYDHFLHT